MKYIILLLCFILVLSETKIPSLDFQQFIKVGSYKITHINDGGTYIHPKSLYPESTSSFWDEHKDLLNENGNIFLSFGGFLFETKNKKVLMDLGLGSERINVKGIGFASGGPYLKNLEKAGVKPEEITDVFFTHLHQDNVGWTTFKKDGKFQLTFPKANYWVSKYEWESFEKGLKKEENEINHDLLKRIYEPLKDIIKFAQEREEIAPGLFPISAPGHSPGLFILKLEAEGKVIWFTSDIFHSVAEFYDITLFSDLDHTKFSKETRIIILPEFCRPHAVIANARFGKYVFGKLSDINRKLNWDPCIAKECKFYLDGHNLAFQEEDL